jgi:hypothetical protein
MDRKGKCKCAGRNNDATTTYVMRENVKKK